MKPKIEISKNTFSSFTKKNKWAATVSFANPRSYISFLFTPRHSHKEVFLNLSTHLKKSRGIPIAETRRLLNREYAKQRLLGTFGK